MNVRLFFKNFLSFTFILTGVFLLTHVVFAQDVFFESLNETAKSANISSDQNVNFSLMIGEILQGLFGLLGSVFLILTIYGGTMWMTAAGNEERVAKAKKIVIQATIGLIIAVLAFALTDFVFNAIISSTTPISSPSPPVS